MCRCRVHCALLAPKVPGTPITTLISFSFRFYNFGNKIDVYVVATDSSEFCSDAVMTWGASEETMNSTLYRLPWSAPR